MIAEWIPENPCDKCIHLSCKKLDCYDSRLNIYRDKIALINKLLEYQIKTAELNLGGNLQIAVTTWLKSMLEQLEMK